MKKKNYIVYTKKWKLNLVGIRTPINNNINKFNDWLLCFWWDKDITNSSDIDDIKYKIYKITTVPGLGVRKKPTNSMGVGWLVENQYVDSYVLSFHKISDPAKNILRKNTLRISNSTKELLSYGFRERSPSRTFRLSAKSLPL